MITLLLATSMLAEDGIKMTFQPSGATEKLGYYMPVRADFSSTLPASLKTAPAFAEPAYGQMKFGEKLVGFAVDVKDPLKIAVDANGDGDFTNDPAPDWKKTNPAENLTVFTGGTKVDIGRGQPVSVSFYRFDPSDPKREALKSTLLYYGDYGYDVEVNLGGKSYKSYVGGDPGPNTSLSIDRDGNGKPSFYYESVKVGKPFNFTGETYLIKADNGKLTLEKAEEKISMSPMPPDLSVGKQVLPFKAKTTDGTEIDFPNSYKGKIVMLDFWATWCGPCMAEVPNVVKNYQEFHDKGLEILGISFDQENSADKVASVTKDNSMTWKQIYEGKYWNTTLGHQYDVAAIPFCLLIDGDTGEILATAETMRGEDLKPTIEKAFAMKAKKAGKGN